MDARFSKLLGASLAKFYASYLEQDRYGNETVYKSVIQYEDGSLDLIFDLWFNYKN